MAYLLGSKFCIESLRSDVSDLQEAVTDVISRAGPVRCPSWKYPDKQALDINVSQLLEQHNYSEDEEERQVAHIVLLELVVDRLVLLLQTMSGYMDQILTLNRNTGSATAGPSSNSIGLAVKKYWNKLVHVFTVAQQLQSENKSRSRKIADLENTVKKLNLENGRSTHAGSVADLPLSTEAVDLLTKSGLLEAMGSPSPAKLKEISHDEYNKSTQTLETAFIPCESCHEVQKNLRRVGDTVTAICQGEGLPCSLIKYREQIQGLEWLSANDVSRWTAEQNKDLERIQKHLRSLYETIEPLKKDLATAETKKQNAEDKAMECKKQMKLEQETLRTQQKQFQGKMDEVKSESKQEIEKVNKQKDEIIANKQELERQLQTLQGEMEKQKECLNELETTRNVLEEKLKESDATEDTVATLETELQTLKEKLNDVDKELKDVNKELNKERAKTRSFTRHQEAVQGKQEHLLKRIDEMDKENVELQDRVAELEDQEEQLKEEKEKLQDALDRANENYRDSNNEMERQKNLLKQMEDEKSTVEDSMKELEDEMMQMKQQLQDAKERERLIIEFPDLHGPVNPDVTGTGDVTRDMENQVKANSIRIQVLEEQNSGLRKAISKMLQSQRPLRSQVADEPMQLWQQSPMEIGHRRSPPDGGPPQRSEQNGELYAYRSPPTAPSPQSRQGPPQVLHNTFVVSPPPGSARRTRTKTRPPSGSSQKSRPASGVSQKGHSENSSINTYIKLKNSGLLGKPNTAEMRYLLDRGKNKPHQEEENYQRDLKSAVGNNYAGDVVICENCDKIYKNKQDLDIHRSYCLGDI